MPQYGSDKNTGRLKPPSIQTKPEPRGVEERAVKITFYVLFFSPRRRTSFDKTRFQPPSYLKVMPLSTIQIFPEKLNFVRRLTGYVIPIS